MADVLDPILPVEHLFDSRGSFNTEGGSPIWVPHHQGDVFSQISMPGLEDTEDNFAMLFMHPCTMRNGAVLRPKVTMIRVEKHVSRKRILDQPEDWNTKFKVMPLPDMLGSGVGTYYADFMSIATVDSSLLDRRNRIARLSLPGRAQFQQRIIFHMTRFAPSVHILEEATAAVEEELSLQEDWVGESVRFSSSSQDDIERSEKEFDEYLSDTSSVTPLKISDNSMLERISRRDLLGVRSYQRRVSAEIRIEIDTRFP